MGIIGTLGEDQSQLRARKRPVADHYTYSGHCSILLVQLTKNEDLQTEKSQEEISI